MTRTVILPVCAALALGTAGCSQQTQQAAQETASSAANDAKGVVSDAAQQGATAVGEAAQKGAQAVGKAAHDVASKVGHEHDEPEASPSASHS